MLESEGIPLLDSVDQDILKHREVHFGGNFIFMIEYYENEGRGCHPEFDLERIQELAAIEQQMGENLAPLYLTASEAEHIARAKNAYKQLKKLYEGGKTEVPQLIADLILNEEEDTSAVVNRGKEIVPSLIELIRSEDFHDPLFPGYGLAPVLAAECLGKIGDERAIISLFEMVHDEDFFDDDTAIKALSSIGDEARDFLIRVLEIRPLTLDNERALVALLHFVNDGKVAQECLKMLSEEEFQKKTPFANYLALGCSGLKDVKDRERFAQLTEKVDESVKLDIQAVLNEWKS